MIDDDITSGLAGALSWVVDELGQLVEPDFDVDKPRESRIAIRKISRSSMPCWLDFTVFETRLLDTGM